MVSTLRIYEVLARASIEDKKPHAITMAIERALEENNARQAKVLMTKDDLFNSEHGMMASLENCKTELIRWMFVGSVAQVAAMALLFHLLR